ncbi:MAG: heparinase II/III family protein [Planctomycetaceae bacterium]|nr:heparinase II/III family protein [Planctomycetaceae bacterium]
MKTLFPTLLAVLFMAIHVGADAQTVRQIDPARLKAIEYPPLTIREGKDLTLPVPPAEHPRLYFRKSHIAELKTKAEHPLLKDAWERINRSANVATDGKLEQGVIMNYNLRIIDAIEARAFLYVLTGDKKMGNEAVDLLFNMNNTLIINPQKQDVTREIGRVIFATAVVYDWCYDLIAPEEKKSLIAIMESLAADMEIKWPLLVQGSVTGHGVEAQYARDVLAFGIAVYDENPDIYRRAAGRIFAELIPAQNFTYLSGYHHQGSAYGPYRFSWEVLTTMIFDRMGYPNITSPLQGQMPYWWIYTRRPDGQLFRDGDDWIDRNPFGQVWTFPDIAYTASFYKDPILMGEAQRQGSIGRTPLYDLLFVDPSVPADADLTSLPLTRFFPYPFGGMVARTGWERGATSDTAMAEMKIVERQYNNHQHLDSGSFQLYYKGPLAVDSGLYEGVEGAYGSPHFQNYYQRTIAHNCMLVYNPDEAMTWHGRPVANDGGQRWPGRAGEPRNIDVVMSEEYKKGEVKTHDFGPDPMKPEYSYLKGDITRAYTDKVKNHQRAFVFLNLDNTQVPAALIVYDYVVSSNKDFKKTWLLHCVQEPVFSGNVCTVIRNEKGYSGKLVNTVLLPQSMVLEKVGGPGNEYSVDGVNYFNRIRNDNNSSDGAIWRVELSPATPAETDVFLNVMQVTDAENTQLLPVEKIETDQMTGVQIGDRIVLFAKNGNLENQPINLPIKGSGTFKVLMTDLVNGNWEVLGSGTPGVIRVDRNLIYFQATAGDFRIERR